MRMVFSILLLFYLFINLKIQGQSTYQKQKRKIFDVTDFQWNYDKLPPDTAEIYFQKGQFVDSIKNAFFSSNNDSNQVWKYYLIGQKYLFINPDSTRYYAHKGKQIAEKINYEPGIYYCTRLLAWVIENNAQQLAIYFNLLKRAQSMQ